MALELEIRLEPQVLACLDRPEEVVFPFFLSLSDNHRDGVSIQEGPPRGFRKDACRAGLSICKICKHVHSITPSHELNMVPWRDLHGFTDGKRSIDSPGLVSPSHT